MATGNKELKALRKGDQRKALLARKTTVSREWQGHPGSAGRMPCEAKRNLKLMKRW
jgi:hypothetical protein